MSGKERTEGDTDDVNASFLFPTDVIQQNDHIPGHFTRATYPGELLRISDK